LKKLVYLLVTRNYAAALLLLGLAGVLYGNSLGNDFHYDDRHSIRENYHLRTLANLPEFFVDAALFSRDPDKAMYRPLLLSSLALNHAWSGYEVYSYHLVNILLHGLCALLVWGILREIGRPVCMALLGGLLFVVHPVCTEPVNYISSRSELMAALGVLGSFWLYLLARRRPQGWIRAASVVFFALGLLSKSVAITLPALLLCGDWCQGRLERRHFWRYLPYGVVALIYLGMVGGFVQKAVFAQPVRSLEMQLGTQVKALLYYVQLLFMPVNLNVHHGFAESGLSDPAALASLLVLVSLAACFAARSKSRNGVFLGVGWIALTLAPTILVPLNVLVNEHRLYLPLVGAIILLTGMERLERVPGLLWGTVLVLGLMGVMVTQRNMVWKNEFTLWSEAANQAPLEVRPYVYMGNYLRENGAPEKALELYEKALQLDPHLVAARNNQGNTYRQLQRWEEAIKTYQMILREQPQLGDVRYNLALSYQEAGELERARQYYLSVAPENYHYDLALNNLGTLHERQGRPDSAYYYYRAAVVARPQSRDGRSNLERLERELGQHVLKLRQEGRLDQIEALCRQVLERNQRHRQARYALALCLYEQRRYSDSIVENKRLLEYYPDYGEGYLHLAAALEASGRLGEARQAYQDLLDRGGDPEVLEDGRQRLQHLRSQKP
jgi:tetratricopeptide (TPR) repeat protein